MSLPVELDRRDARERLILQHVPLLKHIVGRMTVPNGFDRDDLSGIGMLGLIAAADSWEPQRGLKFSTYAYTKIRGAILDELRRCDWLSRGSREKLRELERTVARLQHERGGPPTPEELARALGTSVEDVDELLVAARGGLETSLDEQADESSSLAALLRDPSSPDPAGSAEWNESKERLARAITTLPEQEQTVITLYYAENLLLREISTVLGVTESRVSQIHSRAIWRLNRSLCAPDREGSD
jgi:RNA polymerase sigma factor for flagellar operon FliA